MGVGMVSRDDTGVYIVARSFNCASSLKVDKVEAWGILETLFWTSNMGFQRVVVETDAKRVDDALLHRDDLYDIW